ncbi:MAG TPA: hypothetical protein VK716_15375 [Terracidiphilus sp.]|jgi:hypothetical protein|nr:hypothetical protein [Terracidiphilus sp.]
MNLRLFVWGIVCGCLSGSCISMHGQTTAASEPPSQRTVAAAIPRMPDPLGPYGIGRVGYDWTDSTRPDRFASNPAAHRELMVYFWYPTRGKADGVKGSYLPGAAEMDRVPEIQREMRGEFAGNWPLIVDGEIFSHAVEHAAVTRKPSKLPMILLSHGSGGTGFEYTALIEYLVSHGYVVASIEHTETAAAVLFPDGRIISFHRDSAPPGLSQEEQFKRMVQSATLGIEEGAGDVRFVLNRLTDLSQGDGRDFVLAGRLDLTRVVAMGHSAGAEFAARACELDARFKACIDLDGGMVPVAALPVAPDGETMKQPLLFLEAYHPESRMGGTHEQHVEYFKKREEQLESCPKGTYAVVLRSPGIMHGSFSDYALLSAAGRSEEVGQALHNLDQVEAFTSAFLDRTLNHEKGTLLAGGMESHPEADVVAYGH